MIVDEDAASLAASQKGRGILLQIVEFNNQLRDGSFRPIDAETKLFA